MGSVALPGRRPLPGDEIELRGPDRRYCLGEAPETLGFDRQPGSCRCARCPPSLRHRRAVLVRLLYSARSLEDVIYRDELTAADRSDVRLTLTRRQPAGWSGYGRRVDRELVAEVCWPAAERPLVYVCGPTGFVEAVAGALVSLGHDAARIRTERFGPTGGETP